MGGLLLDEGVNLSLLRRRHAVSKISYAFDEERFALWKGEREAIVKRRGDGIAAVPPTLRCSAAAEHHIAGLDTQIRGRRRRMIHGALDQIRGALTLVSIY